MTEMKYHIYKDGNSLTNELARWICNLVTDTLKNQEYFTLALSGGETPKILFQKLASKEFREKICWQRIHIFWGDERFVPFNDPRNNAKAAFDLLISNLTIPLSQVHIIRTDIEPVFAAQEYERMLRTFFNNTSKSFDLILLGLGDDGHTLSLFPGSTLIENQYGWVSEAYNDRQHMYRITLLPDIVNRASHIAFMVDGEKKATIVGKVLNEKYQPGNFPAQIIKPENGELHWFLDEAAAKNLKR
jgi:6-phosphogluconolactonase